MLVYARGRVFAHFFFAPPWGIYSFSKKWQMPGGRGGGGGGAGGWARLELNEPLLAKQKVKMAVYWPSSSFRFYWPSRGQ